MLKTGGNTIKTIISRNYKPFEIFQITQKGKYTGTVNDFINLPQETIDSFKVLRGHHDFGLHRLFTNNALYFTILRNPVSRLVSFYNHISTNKNPFWRNLIPPPERDSFLSFIENIDKYHSQGNNGQIKSIIGGNINVKNPVKKAKTIVANHFAAVGFLENYSKLLNFLSMFL